MTDIPTYDVDMYTDAVLLDAYPHFSTLRKLGPAVWLPQNNLWAISRHADVKSILADHATFISGKGVSANDFANQYTPGNSLASDPPEHDLYRKIIDPPLHMRALTELKPRVVEAAEGLIDRLVERGSFDGVTDFAQFLPLHIVSELVGLPEDGRSNLLRWAAAAFDFLGGDNQRSIDARDVTSEMRAYTKDPELRDRLKPDGWAIRLFEAADEGLIPPEKSPVLMRDYLSPSLDTTIFASSYMLYFLGTNPDQWARLRENPNLIGSAINESVRLASPVRWFTRYVAEPSTFGSVTIPKGDRVLVIYASANRDAQAFEDPDRFDIGRETLNHLGFGHGIHMCAGMQLARLEMRALLTAMIARIKRFEVGEPVMQINNVLNGLKHLPVRVTEAA